MDGKAEDLLRRHTEIVAGGGEAKVVYPGDTTIFTIIFLTAQTMIHLLRIRIAECFEMRRGGSFNENYWRSC